MLPRSIIHQRREIASPQRSSPIKKSSQKGPRETAHWNVENDFFGALPHINRAKRAERRRGNVFVKLIVKQQHTLACMKPSQRGKVVKSGRGMEILSDISQSFFFFFGFGVFNMHWSFFLYFLCVDDHFLLCLFARPQKIKRPFLAPSGRTESSLKSTIKCIFYTLIALFYVHFRPFLNLSPEREREALLVSLSSLAGPTGTFSRSTQCDATTHRRRRPQARISLIVHFGHRINAPPPRHVICLFQLMDEQIGRRKRGDKRSLHPV